MAVLESLARAVAIVGAGLFAFVIGTLAWGAFSGALAGLLSGFGIPLPAPALIALGPVAGAAVAIGTIMVVFD